eukprot:GEMP01006910.1.p1 GENE.GEMP01006910.1~~GEMP01006910.1.p1  ORF type:complete len:502 (+),score=129.69 GEMP01006910.1:278-1783(+)
MSVSSKPCSVLCEDMSIFLYPSEDTTTQDSIGASDEEEDVGESEYALEMDEEMVNVAFEAGEDDVGVFISVHESLQAGDEGVGIAIALQDSLYQASEADVGEAIVIHDAKGTGAKGTPRDDDYSGLKTRSYFYGGVAFVGRSTSAHSSALSEQEDEENEANYRTDAPRGNNAGFESIELLEAKNRTTQLEDQVRHLQERLNAPSKFEAKWVQCSSRLNAVEIELAYTQEELFACQQHADHWRQEFDWARHILMTMKDECMGRLHAADVELVSKNDELIACQQDADYWRQECHWAQRIVNIFENELMPSVKDPRMPPVREPRVPPVIEPHMLPLNEPRRSSVDEPRRLSGDEPRRSPGDEPRRSLGDEPRRSQGDEPRRSPVGEQSIPSVHVPDLRRKVELLQCPNDAMQHLVIAEMGPGFRCRKDEIEDYKEKTREKKQERREKREARRERREDRREKREAIREKREKRRERREERRERREDRTENQLHWVSGKERKKKEE